jgi:hypothetical protein
MFRDSAVLVLLLWELWETLTRKDTYNLSTREPPSYLLAVRADCRNQQSRKQIATQHESSETHLPTSLIKAKKIQKKKICNKTRHEPPQETQHQSTHNTTAKNKNPEQKCPPPK